MMLRLLLIFTVSLALARPTLAGETAHAPSQTVSERSFLTGLTPMNFDESPAGTERMKAALAKNADVVAVYLDWGVPWPEVFEGQPFHDNVRKEIAAVKQRISPQHQVFLALNAGAFNRREMAGYWGEKTQMPRPGRWADKGLDDPDVITAFGNYCERMIAEFQPTFLCYAIEINMMAGAEPKRFDQLVVLAERVYPRLKAKHPKLLVFPTFQIDFGVPGNAGGEQAVRRLMPHSDAIAVSTYPHIRGFTPETLPAGWLADVRKLASDKVFIVAETGYPAAPYSGTWFNQQVRTDSSASMQAAYLGWLLAESNRLDARLVTWFFPEDINKYLEQEVKRQPEAAGLAALAMNLGLHDQQACPRPALEQWQTWKRKPLASQQGPKGDQ
jgi:hypothetical protein